MFLTKLLKRDLEMMRLTCEMELSLVADRLNITQGTIHSRFAWLRKKRVEAQRFINTINGFERGCPKLRKLLTPGSIKDQQEEVKVQMP
jgi:hypothetical protein